MADFDPRKWQVVEVSPDPPSFWSEAKAVASNILPGAGELAGLAADLGEFGVAFNPMAGMPGLYDRRMREQALDFGTAQEVVKALADVGVQEVPAQTGVGRVLGRGARMLPSAVIPGGQVGLAGRAGIAGLGGMSGGLAKEVTDNPVVVALADLLGGTLPSLGKRVVQKGAQILRPLGPGASEKLAADVYKTQVARSAEDAEDIARALSQADEAPVLGEFTTPAEITGRPEMAQFQQTMARQPMRPPDTGPYAGFRTPTERTVERATERARLVQDIAPDAPVGADVEVAGEALRGIYQTQKQKTRDIAADLIAAKNIDPNDLTSISLKGAKRQVNDRIYDIFGEYAGGLTGPYRAFYKNLSNAPSSLPIREVQNLRSRALSLGRQAARAGDDQVATVMDEMGESLKNAVDTAAANKAGMTPAQAERWGQGRAAWQEYIANYKTGVARDILRTEPGTDIPKIAAEKIPKKIATSSNATMRFMKNIAPGEEGRNILRGYFVDTLQSRLDKPKTFANYVRDIKPGLRQAFDEDQVKLIERVADDVISEANIEDLARRASRRGSPTEQFTNAGQYLKAVMARSLGRLAGITSRLGTVGVGVGGTLAGGWLAGLSGAIGAQILGGRFQTVEQGINAILLEAATNKNVAAQLLRAPTKPRIDALIPQMETAIARIAAPSAAEQLTEDVAQPTELGASPDLTGWQVVDEGTEDKGFEIIPEAKADTPVSGWDIRPIVKSMIDVESGRRRRAVSSAGAQGLMQLMPKTGQEVFNKLGLEGSYDPFDPKQNVQLGTEYFKEQLNRFGDIELALAAYNAGPTKVSRAIRKAGRADFNAIKPYLRKETRQYVPKVMRGLQ